jgi:murein DD-endopeptidase MepM/ murein hydrolase activator NlpD
VAKLRGAGGVPASSDPTFSFALPGAAPLGVPNFFIDSFQIPPFLLPIYQAAGIEYDVPWQVLAAINWIETDYGRNLSVSSAGAVGWMQFLPSTFKKYGVDATGSGYADPYNPTDAIFSAARYLQAAGASKNLARAIFAYNHASWYVQSVLLRAQLIGGMPRGLIGALTGLVEGHFPVAAPARYADDDVERLAARRVHGANAAIPIGSDPTSTGTAIYAAKGAPVIAVNDGRVVKVGRSARLGRYLVLQDGTGNTYTYANLGSIPATYPVPRPVRITAADIARELSVVPGKGIKGSTAGFQPAQAPAPTPGEAASAGVQTSGGAGALSHAGVRHSVATPSSRPAGKPSSLLSLQLHPLTPRAGAGTGSSGRAGMAQPLVKERLFANPSRPNSYAAGGAQQLAQSFEISRFRNYFSDVLHLGRNQYTLAPLRKGAVVVAGTILGRIGAGTSTSASHLYFMVQPAGLGAPYIDPKPILDGWKLLEATAVYRAAGLDPFLGKGQKSATIGQILLESKQQLESRVLADPRAQIYQCGRRDIQAGTIDRRILAAIEYLTNSGLDPTITGLACGAGSSGGIDAAGRTGASMDISAINGIAIQGHQGPGSIADITIRRLLQLQGALAPNQIISLMSYKGQPSALRLPDHADRIQVAYTPAFGRNKQLAGQVRSLLKPKQWIQLIQRISQIPEPSVPTAPSRYAFRTKSAG